MPGPGTCGASGAITATFTWNGQGNPPAVIIIKESGLANWGGDYGAADDGLGHAYVPFAYGGVSSGDRYQVKNNPGQSFSLPSVSPSASVTQAPSGPSGLVAGSIGVSYTVSYTVPSIVFGGGLAPSTGNPYQRYLIGQQATAGLSLGAVPVGVSATTWSWTISDGSPFEAWGDPNTQDVHPTQNQAKFYDLTAWGLLFNTNPWAASTLLWHFKEPVQAGDVYVTDTSHVTLPPGALPASGLDITVQGTCDSQRPQYETFSAYTPQNPYPNNQYLLPGYPPDGVGLYDMPSPDRLQFLGIYAPGLSRQCRRNPVERRNPYAKRLLERLRRGRRRVELGADLQ